MHDILLENNNHCRKEEQVPKNSPARAKISMFEAALMPAPTARALGTERCRGFYSTKVNMTLPLVDPIIYTADRCCN